MRNRQDRSLQLGHQRFQSDGQAITKTPLRAIADDTQEPGTCG